MKCKTCDKDLDDTINNNAENKTKYCSLDCELKKLIKENKNEL